MANTSFRIRAYSGTGTPDEPPINAWPVGHGSNQVPSPPTVIWPAMAAMDGLMRPCAAVGLPYTEFGRQRIDGTGYAWYTAFFTGTALYAQVKVNLFDERTQAWAVWAGYMWRPTHAAPIIAGLAGPEWTDFRVRITALTASSW